MKPIEDWQPMEFAAAIGMDALRIALGHKPTTFSVDQVVAWLHAMAEGRS